MCLMPLRNRWPSFFDKTYQLVRNFQLRAELIKITSFERAKKTEQEYQIFSKTYFQVPSKNFLKQIPQQR